MKTTRAMSLAAGCLAGVLAVNALAADPAVTDVTVRQRWPWSRLVDIDYVLTCDPTQRVDIAVQAYNGSEKLSFPLDALSGDLMNVRQGLRRIVWDPAKTGYTNEALTRFSVELTPTDPPVYMIVDLTKAAGAEGQIEYVYKSDLAAGAWGAVVTNPVAGVESVVWTGVTNDVWGGKTDKIVLRRVPAGTFIMGKNATTNSVTLTKDYYVGVFEVTIAQWGKVTTGTSGTVLTPKISVSYNTIRGATNDLPAVNWFLTGSDVTPASFMGVLRTKTGISGFDLPTEAQWEYACRANTVSYFSDGLSTSSADTGILNELAWWTGNSSNATHPVGLKLPNAWGLYDIHGNVWEWCLDWYASSLAGELDPAGAVSGSSRVIRGGGKAAAASTCGSADRSWTDPALGNSSGGLRLVVMLP